MNVIDRIVGYFSPSAALNRMQDRRAYDFAINNEGEVQRAYDAARTNRLNSSWRAYNRSADLELQDDADTVRARARDLVRNNAYARGIIRAKVRNIVGAGIKPQARVKNSSGDENETFNEQIEKIWDRFQREIDVTGHQTFYEMQQTIVSEVAEAGEVLVKIVKTDDPSRQIPFALELIDIDRLSDHQLHINEMNGNEIRRGIEIDKTGKVVAYWLFPYHPNDINTIHVTPERMPAEDFIHLFRPTRVGQTRGISDFAPVVQWLKNLDKYMDNEMTSSTVASCFSVVIKSLGAGSDGGILGSSTDDGTDDNGNQFEYLEPAIVSRLFPGEDIQTIDPSRGHTEAIAWITLMLRSMGVGTGLSYERLTRDYSQTNYSSNRASDLEDRREFRMEQQWLIDHLCIPVWIRFISLAVANELEGMPSPFEFIANFHDWTEHEWQPPGWEWVDPLKEVTATVMAVENNLTTLAKETLKRDGSDWRHTIKQRGLEKELQSNEGLITDQATQSDSTKVTRRLITEMVQRALFLEEVE